MSSDPTFRDQTDEEPDDGSDDTPDANPDGTDAGEREGESAAAADTGTDTTDTDTDTDTGTGTGADTDADDGVDESADAGAEGGGGPSLVRLGAVARSLRLAWAVAMVSLLVAIVAAVWASSILRDEAQEQRALERAELVAEQVTTFRGDQIDEWVSETQELATGAYAEQVAGLFDDEFRGALEDHEVESTGEIRHSYLQELEGDSATVFIVADQRSTNVLRDEPVEDELRMEIAMTRENGEWYASDISVLGPAPAAPGDPGLDEVPDADDAEDGDADADEGAVEDGEGEDDG